MMMFELINPHSRNLLKHDGKLSISQSNRSEVDNLISLRPTQEENHDNQSINLDFLTLSPPPLPWDIMRIQTSN